MRCRVFALAFMTIAVPAAAQTAASSPDAPYAGQQSRSIKALSLEERHDLAAGRGMGLAKTAELNGYPGPLHVLELSAKLQLTAEQRAASAEILRRMKEDAQRLGAAILEAETALDLRFQHRHIDRESLRSATASVAALQGELRAVHLAAHLDQAALLTPAQIAEYNRQRGYESATPGAEDGGHRQH